MTIIALYDKFIMKTIKTMKNRYYIKEAERYLGVYREKLFYWERKKKIPRAKRETMSGYRYWTLAELKKIKKIIRG